GAGDGRARGGRHDHPGDERRDARGGCWRPRPQPAVPDRARPAAAREHGRGAHRLPGPAAPVPDRRERARGDVLHRGDLRERGERAVGGLHVPAGRRAVPHRAPRGDGALQARAGPAAGRQDAGGARRVPGRHQPLPAVGRGRARARPRARRAV
ncbi:MAG: hypothetical protein AVDCRST_MAG11-1423, partial [uncultured Gemmatimonadaceae bacterium]